MSLLALAVGLATPSLAAHRGNSRHGANPRHHRSRGRHRHRHHAPAEQFHYAVPVEQTSPWPTMRRDLRNTAASPIVGRYRGDRPWAFRTGKGIFSTPIVGGDGTVYVGSADTYFYAVSARGKLRWRFKTGNLIDSAGFIGPWNPRLRTHQIVVPSGDEHLYEIRSSPKHMPRRRRIIWSYEPPAGTGAEGQLVNWWEGNAEPGPDGTIYAGNTGDAAYAITPNGKLKWVYRSIGPFWTDPAMTLDGTTYWGSLDLQVHALNASGHDLWRFPTLGFVVSSPALDNTGTLYVGSFDSDLYALDAKTGVLKWKFPTGDHIYSSPALDEDDQGHLRAIYVASTDGRVYAVDPNGHLLWAYDTGDVIRSSPVIGLAPDGVHKIVYVGAGNGALYALNAADGTRRWSFDTTRSDPILHDRNDLNASPALTRTGVVIGGEDGYLKYVPYDYCLQHRDRRCSTNPGQAFPPNLTQVFPVTAGGDTQLSPGTQTVGAATTLPARLVVRRANTTLDAAMQPLPNAAALIHTSPAFPFTAQVSGDGHFVFVVPDGLLTPGTDYTVRVGGTYTANGIAVGNIHLGGTTLGSFDQTLHYRVARPQNTLAFAVGPRQVTAMRLTRLAFPLPAFVTSVNQIGFDSYNLIVGAIHLAPTSAHSGSVLLWAIGAAPGRHGVEEVDPTTTLAFPLGGSYQNNSLAVSAHNATLTFSFGPVPVQRLELRAQLSKSLTALPGASIYGEVNCASVPTYGPLLPTQRLCNNEGKLVTSGTFVTSRYDRAGPANKRPRGLSLQGLTLQRPTPVTAGSAVATLRLAPHATYPASRHFVSILLTDAATGDAVGLDYRAETSQAADGRGNIVQAKLAIPAGTSLPTSIRAYAIADVFPLGSSVF
ncbi:MAG TPA: PQQ-binding-like beta-propeller repeat protein [Solirubrobacteraceae bacterium]|jgi:outer membrane protein assembly factor BamB